MIFRQFPVNSFAALAALISTTCLAQSPASPGPAGGCALAGTQASSRNQAQLVQLPELRMPPGKDRLGVPNWRWKAVCRAAVRSLVVCLFWGYSSFAFSATCAQLTQLSVPHTTVVSAEILHALTIPGRPQMKLPEFCRVIATASPVVGSRIGIEVWIPISGWNGRFEGVGNGGYSSAINYYAMAEALRRGSAVAATDTGHKGADLKFVVGHPERIDDWGFRAIHVMTEFAKLVLRDFEGRFPEYSYFNGCSTGGGQALSEAQRFPDDYGGILAGDPGNDRVNLNTAFLWAYIADHRVPGQQLSESKLQLLHAAALRTCDGNDGIADGVIEDPPACRFDPTVLECKGDSTKDCLTPAEVQTAKAIYAGPSYGGKQIYPGFEPGSEILSGLPIGGWGTYLTGLPDPKRLDFWKYWVFDDAAWDWHSFDFNKDVKYANRKLAAVNSVDPDLRGFINHGGKLLLYHGWADPVVPPESTIQYFNRVTALLGNQRVAQGVRLFLVPGMGHCVGGYGPLPAGNQWPPQVSLQKDSSASLHQPEPDPHHDFLGALERWTENGDAPKSVIGSQKLLSGKLRTRPICAYPLIAKWTGQGSRDDAENFVCALPPVETHP